MSIPCRDELLIGEIDHGGEQLDLDLALAGTVRALWEWVWVSAEITGRSDVYHSISTPSPMPVSRMERASLSPSTSRHKRAERSRNNVTQACVNCRQR